MKIVAIDTYSAWGNGYVSHLKEKGIDVERYSSFEKPKGRFRSKSQIVRNELISLYKVLKILPKIRGKALYVTGCHYAVCLCVRLLGFSMGKTKVYLHNFYIHGMGQKAIIKKVLGFLMNSNRMNIIVQSIGEMDYYRSIAPKMNVSFVPYSSDIKLTNLNGGVRVHGRIYE